MAKKEDLTKPPEEGPEFAELEATLARIAAALDADAGETPGTEGAPASDEIRELADEEAAIEKEAARLKEKRERERELAKFTANAFDRMSTSAVTLGLIGPGVGFLYHTSLLAALKDGELVVATLSCLGAAFVLHCVGRAILNEEFQR
ncbi:MULTISPECIES: hypothetical protein [unclassified Mesorhizobium]|uniref:hypothetical protein n=1 Tax=unclassified Mesorhizobium TaxID=325217 RepID=UPI00333CE4D6